MTRARLVLLALLAAFAVPCFAQSPVPLADTELRHISSKSTGQSYDLLISLPAGYAANKQTYPVLYVLDGWHFPLFAFLQNNNQYSQRMRPVISVTVSHGDDAMKKRAHDFTPTSVAEVSVSGGAPQFLKFLTDELIPYIDTTYRTNPADRGLLGHSYGGMFAIYALEQRPDLFQRIVAASPTVGWDNGVLVKRLANLKCPKPVRLDISVGAEDDVTAETLALVNMLERVRPANLTFRSTVFAGENHNSVRLHSFPNGLYWVYANN